jgi:phosphatidylcholine synthase
MNVTVVVVLSVLVFVPIRYLYPSRTTTARATTIVLGCVWAVMVIALLMQFPRPSRSLAVLSLFFPAYYLGFSVYLHFAREAGPKD